MTLDADATWEFEAADPEVGFLTDSVTHTCQQNLDGDVLPATEDATFQNVLRTNRDGSTEEVVAETRIYTCPACEATTAITEHWPLFMFEDVR